MTRSAPYLGVVAGLGFGIVIIAILNIAAVPRTPATVSISNASSTSPVINASATTSVQVQMASTTKRSTPSPVAAALPVSQPVPTPTPPPPAALLSFDASASALRSALVNIICTAPAGGVLHSISGSGIIIDPKGIILTNAHVAQHFLLADRSVSCTVRSGSPAANGYDAELIYISPAWLRANANVLTQTNASGNGEFDFAFLAVTKSATSVALPSSFPFLPLATMPPPAGTSVVIASYGAQFLNSSQIASNLFPTIVFGSIKNVFTFGTNTIDVLALGGSAAAQEGSSGGGVADVSGVLVGTITTSTVSGTTDTRSLDALTASYIRAEYASETGSALDLLLAKPPASSVAAFAPQISVLESIITVQLP